MTLQRAVSQRQLSGPPAEEGLSLQNPPERLTSQGPLIVKYVHTARPRLGDPDETTIYALALTHSNLFEVWRYQQTFSESDPRLEAEALLKNLI